MKLGELMFSLMDGFQKVEAYSDTYFPIKHGSNIYTMDGRLQTNDVHPSLLTPHQAYLLGYAPPACTVPKKLYQALYRHEKGGHWISSNLFETAEEASQNTHNTLVRLVNPVEI